MSTTSKTKLWETIGSIVLPLIAVLASRWITRNAQGTIWDVMAMPMQVTAFNLTVLLAIMRRNGQPIPGWVVAIIAVCAVVVFAISLKYASQALFGMNALKIMALAALGSLALFLWGPSARISRKRVRLA